MTEPTVDDIAAALEGLTRVMRWRAAHREAERKRARFDATGKLVPRPLRGNVYIRDAAFIREPIGKGDAELWITYTSGREEFRRIREQHPELALTGMLCDPDALNGYVAYPKRQAPRLPMGTGGITQYIPVHGGVTYAEKDSIAAVWGFDTMHYASEKQPRTDPDWIRYQCHILHHGLEVAEDLWPKFRRTTDTAKRAAMVQGLFEIDPGRADRLGTEALLNLMVGKIG
jgi:hypothetical protein